VLIGFLSFFLAGIGLGGGVLLIPILTHFCNVEQADAQRICLLAYLPSAIGVLAIGYRKKEEYIIKISKLIPLGICGSLLGALISVAVDQWLLRKMYGIFMVAFGVYMIFSALNRLKTEKSKH